MQFAQSGISSAIAGTTSFSLLFLFFSAFFMTDAGSRSMTKDASEEDDERSEEEAGELELEDEERPWLE